MELVYFFTTKQNAKNKLSLYLKYFVIKTTVVLLSRRGLGNVRPAGHMRPAKHLIVARKHLFIKTFKTLKIGPCVPL